MSVIVGSASSQHASVPLGALKSEVSLVFAHGFRRGATAHLFIPGTESGRETMETLEGNAVWAYAANTTFPSRFLKGVTIVPVRPVRPGVRPGVIAERQGRGCLREVQAR